MLCHLHILNFCIDFVDIQTQCHVAGSGPVPARPPTGRNTKHHLVFEASRAVSGDNEARQRHTDTRLQAEVYNSPRFDKGEL